MLLGRVIRREFIVIISVVIGLLLLVIGLSYAYFVSIGNGEENTIIIGDLRVSFCEDELCKSNYSNYGQVIGKKIVDGSLVSDKVYPFNSDFEAIMSDPYIFNIKNTGEFDANVTIKLNEEDAFELSHEYEDYQKLTSLYSNNLKVGISDCDNGINRNSVDIKYYNELNNNIIKTDEINSSESSTYCLWTWLDSETPNDVQNTYFIANLDFSAEYVPLK